MAETTQVTIDRLHATAVDLKEELSKVRAMSLEEAAVWYVNFRDNYDYLDSVRDEWSKIKEELSGQIMPEIFERSQQDQSIKLKNGKTVVVSFRTTASIKDKMGGYNWLKENGLGDLIQPTVNASTLASVATGLIEENRSLPSEFFNVSLKPTTAVRGGKK